MAQNLTLVGSPPGAPVTFGSESGTLNAQGVYVTTGQYAAGQYSATLTVGGDSSLTGFEVVDGTSVYQLTPVPTTDDGSGASDQTVSPTGAAAPTSSNPGTIAPATAAAAAPIERRLPPTNTSQAAAAAPISRQAPTSPYEYLDPQSGFGRYFTATQARMYIGNLFIEELAGVQFVLQSNKVPIYGYASEMFDAVGDGKSLVQGQLMINFISEGYLYTVLEEHKAFTGNSTTTPAQQLFQSLLDQQKALQATSNPSAATLSQIASIKSQRQQMMAADPTLASVSKRTTLANSTTAVSKKNGVYRKVPFDIVLELEGGGRTVTRRISNAVLTSNEQIYGDSDSPLIDSYGFIARSLL